MVQALRDRYNPDINEVVITKPENQGFLAGGGEGGRKITSPLLPRGRPDTQPSDDRDARLTSKVQEKAPSRIHSCCSIGLSEYSELHHRPWIVDHAKSTNL